MKINWAMVKNDMLEDIVIPNCPSFIKKEAENIIKIVASTQFEYNTMSSFDKKLTAEYWTRIDGMLEIEDIAEFPELYEKRATNPEHIRRARQWLIEHNFLIPNARVSEYAQKAGDNWRGGLR